MAFTVSPGPLTTDTWVCSECLIFPCQYYSTYGPHPSIYLTLTLYDFSNCQCHEMKRPSKMYKTRLKISEFNFIKRWKCQVPPRCWYLCVRHHRNTYHELIILILSTLKTDFTCILLAFRVAQHDSSS